MKKLLLLLLVGIQASSHTCNLCIGYDGQRRLRKQAPKFVQCDCNCYEQGISKHSDGHKCVKCGHRVLPYNLGNKAEPTFGKTKFINKWKQKKKLKRYTDQKNNGKSEIEKMFLVDVIGG